MILHIAPNYVDKPLYRQLFEAIHDTNCSRKQFVFACDNCKHATTELNSNIHIVDRSFSIIERFLFFPKQRYLLREIEKCVPINEIRLIHAHTLFSSGYLAYQLHKKFGIPYIVAVRNTDVNVFFKHMPHLRHIGREVVAHAQKVIFISPAYRDQVIGKYLPLDLINYAEVIPNGIDPYFLENMSQHSSSKDAIRLIYVGRIEKAKNIHTIVKVADILAEQGKNVKLTLIGKIIDKQYQRLIESRNSHIEWHDQCPKQNVMNFLRKNDIFIMPSYAETFGLVYAEAMSQGLPVIHTKGQGFDGFFPDGEIGYAVPAENAKDIVSAIDCILKNYNKMSNNCVKEVHHFDWKSIAQKYDNIYQSIINTKNS
ncbi:MAG: glycosyltransferase family 4 protein [Paludibacteraceae bacterium]|nr:glycosyltransferase family 4 protein [Paludibacteraceae bacterium]